MSGPKNIGARPIRLNLLCQECRPDPDSLPFDKRMALSKVEGLRYPHPSSLRRTFMYASFLGISEALHMDIFHQPLRSRFFDSLLITLPSFPRKRESRKRL
jgi:hypothetical protein